MNQLSIRQILKREDVPSDVKKTINEFITSRVQLENALVNREGYLGIIENLGQGIGIADINENFIYGNRVMEETFGVSPGKLIGRNILEFVTPENQQVVIKQTKLRRKGKKSTYNLEIIRPNGEICQINVTATPQFDKNGKFTGSFGVVTDITDRLKMEKKIQENEERLRQIVQNMPVMLDAFDENNQIVAWNRECERITGYKAEEMIGKPSALSKIYPDEKKLAKSLAEWQEKGDEFFNWEIDLTHKDGTIKTISWSNISNQFPISGWSSWAVGVDVTDRKKAEKSLKKRTHDLGKRIKELNCLYGVAKLIEDPKIALVELMRKTLQLIVHTWQHPEISCIRIIIDGKQVKSDNFSATPWKKISDIIVFGKNLGIIEIYFAEKTPIIDEGLFTKDEKHLIDTICREIGGFLERRDLEKELLEKRKLAALGTMSMGLAHEMNTPLANINLTSDYLINLINTEDSTSFHSSHILKELLDIKKQSNFCGQIVKNLLIFSREIKLFPKLFNVLSIFTEIISSVSINSRLENGGIKVILEIENDIYVFGDKELLSQCFQNLVMNSIDALSLVQTNPTIKISLIELDHMIEIKIKDNGEGIKEEHLPRIFEPFFTTKKVGKGTGLGLSITRGIIEKHNGKISIKSTYGEGTQVRVILPKENINSQETELT